MVKVDAVRVYCRYQGLEAGTGGEILFYHLLGMPSGTDEDPTLQIQATCYDGWSSKICTNSPKGEY